MLGARRGSRLLGLALLASMSGCRADTLVEAEHARLTVADPAIEFGELAIGEWAAQSTLVGNDGGLPMGVELDLSMTGGPDGPEGGFCVHWGALDSACGALLEAEADPEVEPVICADGELAASSRVELEPGCTVEAVAVFAPAHRGAALGAMVVHTERGEVGDSLPELDGDPVTFVQEVRLDGSGGSAAILGWEPPLGELAWHWPDGSAAAVTMELVNLGAADLHLEELDASACGDAVIVDDVVAGTVLEVGARVPVTFVYTATTEATPECAVHINSAEGASATGVLRAAFPDSSEGPSASVVSPPSGTAVSSDTLTEIVIDLGDDVQPVSTLAVSATAVISGNVVTSTPSDATAQVSVAFPPGSLHPGAETLRVTVTDAHGNVQELALPVRVDAVATDDADRDAWGRADGDCDDSRVDTYPYALELADTRDNDCDGVIDEDTDQADDDGDGSTEADGDCDDADASAGPAMPEVEDAVDNDCDGVVDDRTDAYDDDGDGYRERDNDCDDRDPTASPRAAEVCDGVDNDCNGDVDDGYIDCDPGRYVEMPWVAADRDACVAGETVTLTAMVLQSTPRMGWFAMTLDVGGSWTRVPDTATGERTATIVCPDVRELDDIEVTVWADDDGAEEVVQSTADATFFVDIIAVPAATGVDRHIRLGEAGCHTAGGPTAASLAAAGVALAMARRRKGRSPGAGHT